MQLMWWERWTLSPPAAAAQQSVRGPGAPRGRTAADGYVHIANFIKDRQQGVWVLQSNGTLREAPMETCGGEGRKVRKAMSAAS